MMNMTNKKMWAIIVALVVVVAIIAVATGVFSKPPADDEGTPPDAPTEVVREEKEDEPDVEGTGVEDDVNMGSITGSGQGNEDMSKLPKEEQDRIKAQHEAEQAKTQETTTPPEETQPATPPAQEPSTPPSQPSGPSGTAGTATFNNSPVRAFNSVSELNGLQPIKPFETVMVNGVPYRWTGSEWGDASATTTVGGGSLTIVGGDLSGHQVGE